MASITARGDPYGKLWQVARFPRVICEREIKCSNNTKNLSEKENKHLMSIDINKYFPYNKMKLVTVDGQEMLRIPRIYVKNEVMKSGPYAGKSAYFMNEQPCKGYHVHPAFMSGGQAMSALDLACYESKHSARLVDVPGNGRQYVPASVPGGGVWQGITQNEAIAVSKWLNTDNNNPDKSGWHCWDIYCQHLLARIMLFEFGTTSFNEQVQTYPEFIYRGIHQPAGDPAAPTWIPGIKILNGYIHISDNLGDGGLVNTGLKTPGVGWPTHFSMINGNTFDLGDVFIADAVSKNEIDGTCSDYQRLTGSYTPEVCLTTSIRGVHFSEPTNAHGMFGFSVPGDGRSENRVSTGCGNHDHIRFRLAHWVK